MVLETNCIKQLVKKTGTDCVTTIMASKTPWQWESHCNCTSKLYLLFHASLVGSYYRSCSVVAYRNSQNLCNPTLKCGSQIIQTKCNGK